MTIRRIDDREIPVSRSISLRLLLVPGRPSWLQMRSPTICAFDAVLADRGRLRAGTFSFVSFSGLIDALN